MNVEQSISQAAKVIPIYWPLKSMIAVNPLWDLREMPFANAVEYVKQYVDIKGCLQYDEYIKFYHQGLITNEDLKVAVQEWYGELVVTDNDIAPLFAEEVLDYHREYNGSIRLYSSPEFAFRVQLLEFISGYFDDKQRAWYQTDNEYPLFISWRMHAKIEKKSSDAFLDDLPENIHQALEHLLLKLKIQPQDVVPFFSWVFTQLIGWSGLIKWVEQRPNNRLIKQKATLAELLLIWCCLLYREKSFNFQSLKNQVVEKKKLSAINLAGETSVPTVLRDIFIDDLCFIWQRAYEVHYQQQLLNKLKQQKTIAEENQRIISAQFIFCIDTRSEGIRRHLEKNGKYETFGFAGFFGSLFSLKDNDSQEYTLQSPALVEPNIELKVSRMTETVSKKLSDLYKKASFAFKENVFSPFAFFEMMGNVMALPLIGKTFAPVQYQQGKVRHKEDCIHKKIDNVFLAPDRIEVTVENLYLFLKTIGLIDNMAATVFVCGHQAQTENNPFQASFDCGACGGNSGAINAEVTCEILNNPQARELLVKRGVRFGLNTTFIPAYHNTTTDEFVIGEKYLLSIPFYDQLKMDIDNALKSLKVERMSDLPGINDDNDRHVNWAELIPEWGLANNMAMLIGPRQYSKQLNLNRRAFLHSYDFKNDTDGVLLSSILTAPVVVAHWINSQYYFSSTDREIYGSGNKAIHNIVAQVGVMEGNLSDLKIGLPIQSVFYRDQLVHQPLRLLIVIFAPHHLVTSVLNRLPHIKSLFDNQWLSLEIIEPEAMHGISG